MRILPRKLRPEIVDQLTWQSVLRAVLLRLEPVKQLRKFVQEVPAGLPQPDPTHLTWFAGRLSSFSSHYLNVFTERILILFSIDLFNRLFACHWVDQREANEERRKGFEFQYGDCFVAVVLIVFFFFIIILGH